MKKLFLLLLFIPNLVLSQNKVFDFNKFDKFSQEYVNNDEPGIIFTQILKILIGQKRLELMMLKQRIL